MQRLWQQIDRAAPPPPSIKRSVAVAIAASVIALAASLIAQWLFDIRLPFLFGLAAVGTSAIVGGFWPALLSNFLSVGLTLLFNPRVNLLHLRDIVAIALFSAALAVVGELLYRSRARASAQTWRLLQRETYLQSVFAQLPAAMMVIDNDGIIITYNSNAKQLFGLELRPPGTLLVADIIELPGNLPAAEEVTRYMVQHKLNGQLAKGIKADGTKIDLALTIADVNIAGELFHTIHVRDETASSRASALRAELELEVHQLGRAVALGQLGAAIAHELNQPLASAANYAGAARRLLAREASRDGVDEAIGEALSNIFRASAIMKRLRNFVQPDAVAADWAPGRQMIEEAAHLGELAVRHAGATLRVSIGEGVGAVLVDRVQIQQVLTNLIVNAAQAVASATTRELLLTIERDGSNIVLISLTDTGPGIPHRLRASLFKPFASTKKSGLGVGLSISRAIVEAHGGTIWLDQTYTGGSRFCFTLPHRQDAQSHAAA